MAKETFVQEVFFFVYLYKKIIQEVTREQMFGLQDMDLNAQSWESK